MKTSRVAMQRFGTMFKLNILDSFDEGLEGGLNSFFNSLSGIAAQAGPTFRVLGKFLGVIVDILGVGLQVVYQLFRPFVAVLEELTLAFDSTNGALGFFTTLIKTLAAILLVPFAYLEKINDAVQEMDGGLASAAKGGVWLLNTALLATIARMLGVGKGIAAMVTGIKGIKLATAGLVTVGKALAFTPIGRLIMLGTAAIAGVAAAYDYFTDDKENTTKAANRMTSGFMGRPAKSVEVVNQNKYEVHTTGDPEETRRVVEDIAKKEFEWSVASAMKEY